jgi:hypothetical protein
VACAVGLAMPLLTKKRRWESNPLKAALQAVALPSGSSAVLVSVLARSRTWSSTFAGSRANPPHSEDITQSSAPPRNRTRAPCAAWSGSFEDCHAIRHTRRASSRKCLDQESDLDLDLRRVLCDSLHHRDVQYPDQESNLDQGFRTTPCDPLHHRDIANQSRRLDSHQHDAVYKTAAFLNRATSASTSARSRTPCGRVGICLLSQEHARVSAAPDCYPACRTSVSFC